MGGPASKSHNFSARSTHATRDKDSEQETKKEPSSSSVYTPEISRSKEFNLRRPALESIASNLEGAWSTSTKQADSSRYNPFTRTMTNKLENTYTLDINNPEMRKLLTEAMNNGSLKLDPKAREHLKAYLASEPEFRTMKAEVTFSVKLFSTFDNRQQVDKFMENDK